MVDIFVLSAPEDHAAAEAVARAVAAAGYTPWWRAEDGLTDPPSPEMTALAAHVGAVVTLFSDRSRRLEGLLAIANIAQNGDKFLPCYIDAAASLPNPLTEEDALSLVGWESDPKRFDALLEILYGGLTPAHLPGTKAAGERRLAAAAKEAETWRAARAADDARAYEAYLKSYGDAAVFGPLAKERLAAPDVASPPPARRRGGGSGLRAAAWLAAGVGSVALGAAAAVFFDLGGAGAPETDVARAAAYGFQGQGQGQGQGQDQGQGQGQSEAEADAAAVEFQAMRDALTKEAAALKADLAAKTKEIDARLGARVDALKDELAGQRAALSAVEAKTAALEPRVGDLADQVAERIATLTKAQAAMEEARRQTEKRLGILVAAQGDVETSGLAHEEEIRALRKRLADQNAALSEARKEAERFSDGAKRALDALENRVAAQGEALKRLEGGATALAAAERARPEPEPVAAAQDAPSDETADEPPAPETAGPPRPRPEDGVDGGSAAAVVPQGPAPTQAPVAGGAPTMRQAQVDLRRLGFEPGTIAGDWTETSASALRAFQRIAGLPPTGVLSEREAALLDAAPDGLLSGAKVSLYHLDTEASLAKAERLRAFIERHDGEVLNFRKIQQLCDNFVMPTRTHIAFSTGFARHARYASLLVDPDANVTWRKNAGTSDVFIALCGG